MRLTPPRQLTLEQAIAYIQDDELVEVTPQSIRLRKRYLVRMSGRRWRARTVKAPRCHPGLDPGSGFRSYPKRMRLAALPWPNLLSLQHDSRRPSRGQDPFLELIDFALAGEDVVITRRGVPMARLEASSARESTEAFLKRMRKADPVDEATVAELEAALAKHKVPHNGIDLEA